MVIVAAVVEPPARVPVGRWPLKFRTYDWTSVGQDKRSKFPSLSSDTFMTLPVAYCTTLNERGSGRVFVIDYLAGFSTSTVEEEGEVPVLVYF